MGVIVTLTVRIARIDKYSTIWRNEQSHELDDICIETGSFRYMHSRTTKDPDGGPSSTRTLLSANRVGSVRAAAEEAPCVT